MFPAVMGLAQACDSIAALVTGVGRSVFAIFNTYL